MEARNRFTRLGAGLIAVGLLFLTSGVSMTALGAPPSQVVICHYDSGQGGKYTTQEVSPSAADNHLTTHENDYLGECQNSESSTTSTVSESTSTTASEPTSTTTSQPTTTLASESTTTTTTDPTTTTLASESTTTTTTDPTTTTLASETTTTTLAIAADVVTTVASESTTTLEEASTPTSTGASPTTSIAIAADNQSSSETTEGTVGDDPGVADETDATAIEALPFTGINLYVAVPGMVLIAIGGLVVLASYTLARTTAGDHVADRRPRLAPSLHKGRHQA